MPGAVLGVAVVPTEIYPRLMEAQANLRKDPARTLDSLDQLIKSWSLATNVNQPEGALRMEALFIQAQSLAILGREHEALEILDEVLWDQADELENRCLLSYLPRCRQDDRVEWSEPARAFLSRGFTGESGVFAALTDPSSKITRMSNSAAFRCRYRNEQMGTYWDLEADFRVEQGKVFIDWVQEVPTDANLRLATARSYFEVLDMKGVSRSLCQAAFLCHRHGLVGYAVALVAKSLVFDSDNQTARASMDNLKAKQIPITLADQLLPDRILIAPEDRHRSYPRPVFSENPIMSRVETEPLERVREALSGTGHNPLRLCRARRGFPEILGLRLSAKEAESLTKKLRARFEETLVWPVVLGASNDDLKKANDRRWGVVGLEALMAQVEGRPPEGLSRANLPLTESLAEFLVDYKKPKKADAPVWFHLMSEGDSYHDEVIVALLAVEEVWEASVYLNYSTPFHEAVDHALYVRKFIREFQAFPVALTPHGAEFEVRNAPLEPVALRRAVLDHAAYCPGLVEPEEVGGYAEEIGVASTWFFPWE